MIEDARAVFINHCNENTRQQVREEENVRAKESRRHNWHEVLVNQSDREGLYLSDRQRMQLWGLSSTTLNENLKCKLLLDAIKLYKR